MSKVSEHRVNSKEWHKDMVLKCSPEEKAYLWVNHPTTWDENKKQFIIFSKSLAHLTAAKLIESGAQEYIGIITVAKDYVPYTFQKNPFSNISKTNNFTRENKFQNNFPTKEKRIENVLDFYLN